jgi:hypothetical protein
MRRRCHEVASVWGGNFSLCGGVEALCARCFLRDSGQEGRRVRYLFEVVIVGADDGASAQWALGTPLWDKDADAVGFAASPDLSSVVQQWLWARYLPAKLPMSLDEQSWGLLVLF